MAPAIEHGGPPQLLPYSLRVACEEYSLRLWCTSREESVSTFEPTHGTVLDTIRLDLAYRITLYSETVSTDAKTSTSQPISPP